MGYLVKFFSELSTRRWESILKTTGMVMGPIRKSLNSGRRSLPFGRGKSKIDEELYKILTEH